MAAVALRSGTTGGVPDGPRGTLSLRLASTTEDVRAALAHVTAKLSSAGMCRDALGTLELVLAEALNNVVEHAYAGCAEGSIEVRLHWGQAALRLEVRDAGAPMPDLVLPQGRLVPLGAGGDLPEGGFGWYLIRKLATDVSYRREDGQNLLELVVPAPAAQGG